MMRREACDDLPQGALVFVLYLFSTVLDIPQAFCMLLYSSFGLSYFREPTLEQVSYLVQQLHPVNAPDLRLGPVYQSCI